jgi:hypothetical protein
MERRLPFLAPLLPTLIAGRPYDQQFAPHFGILLVRAGVSSTIWCYPMTHFCLGIDDLLPVLGPAEHFVTSCNEGSKTCHDRRSSESWGWVTIAPLDKSMATSTPETVTGEDGLSAQISQKFISDGLQVGFPVDDAAADDALLARLANQHDRPGLRDLVFDLNRTVLVARGDDWRAPIP